MKRLITCIFILLFNLPGYSQQQPEWIRKRPVNTMYYTGIGRSLKSEADYQQKAKLNALNDLVSEIRVEISSNSLLHTLDDGKEVQSLFQENIRSQVKQDIEKFQLVDSWQNELEYWVYYELNKFDYEEYMEARRSQAVRQGSDCWLKGQQALQKGDLSLAAEMFMRGLEMIHPCIHEELRYEYQGQKTDIANELYNSLKNVFTGLVITPSVRSLTGKAFQGIEEVVIIKVTKGGIPLRNLSLQYDFKTGSGRLSGENVTDEAGEAKLYVRNISSKLSRQEIYVTIDHTPFKNYQKNVYGSLLRSVSEHLPVAIIQIRLENQEINALLQTQSGGHEGVIKAVRSLLTNHYFNLVNDPAVADVTVKINSGFHKGGNVPGEMYDFTEYFSGVSVTITNNRNRAELLNYIIADFKTVVPQSTSEANAKASATREILKRLNRELALALKNLELNTTGDIPVNAENQDIPTDIPRTGSPPKDPEEKPVKQPNPIEGEFEPGIFIRYISKKEYSGRSILEFKIINKTNKDYEMDLYLNSQKIINAQGEELKIDKAKLGSNESNWSVKATILPEVNTTLYIHLPVNDKIKFIQFANRRGMVKLRNLE